jgi:hypothetical protein
MPIPEIEEFAKLLTQRVRDAAIQNSDMNLRSNVQHIIAKRWRSAADSSSPENFAKTIIPDVVDEAIFQLLRSIDEGVLKLQFRSSNGRTVDLTSEGTGELAGWYSGHGWKERYAKERFSDNFPDIKP